MQKILTLTFILFIQPLFVGLIWRSISTLFTKMDWLADDPRKYTVIAITLVLFMVFCIFFSRGFLGSNEAKQLGF